MGELFRVALSGPLEEIRGGLRRGLARQGYAPSVVVIHVRRLVHVSRWLEARGLGAAALDEAAGEAFLADRRAAGRSPAAHRVADAAAGVSARYRGGARFPGRSCRPRRRMSCSPGMPATWPPSVAWLRETVARNVVALRPVLAGLGQRMASLGLGRLTAREVTASSSSQSRQRPGAMPAPGDGAAVAAAVPARRRRHRVRLAGAVPTAAGRKLAGLPRHWPPGRWPRCWRPATWPPRPGAVTGRSCAAVPPGAAGRRGRRAAAGRHRLAAAARSPSAARAAGTSGCPLPADVGEAIVAYLRDGRPPRAGPGGVRRRPGPAPRR